MFLNLVCSLSILIYFRYVEKISKAQAWTFKFMDQAPQDTINNDANFDDQ